MEVLLHEVRFYNEEDEPVELDFTDLDERSAEMSYWQDYSMMMNIIGQTTLYCIEDEPDKLHYVYAGAKSGL